MDKTLFVQNVIRACGAKNVRPTVACRESGAGERLIENVKRGSSPSVDKVEALAHYLGLSVSDLIGDAVPGELRLRDSASAGRASDMLRLSLSEVEMALAYRAASPKERGVIDLMLADYLEENKKGTTGTAG